MVILTKHVYLLRYKTVTTFKSKQGHKAFYSKVLRKLRSSTICVCAATAAGITEVAADRHVCTHLALAGAPAVVQCLHGAGEQRLVQLLIHLVVLLAHPQRQLGPRRNPSPNAASRHVFLSNDNAKSETDIDTTGICCHCYNCMCHCYLGGETLILD